MILKVRRSSDKGAEFTVFDHCTRVQYEGALIALDAAEPIGTGLAQHLWGMDDFPVHEALQLLHDLDTHTGPGSSVPTYVGRIVQWISPDGKGNTLFTDGMIYLMNDDGETIERL